MALNNEIKLLKASKNKKKSGKDKRQKGNFDNDNPSDKGNNKSKKKPGKNDCKWAWKEVPPSEGETSKKFEGKTYYFCPKHKAWCLHKPEECRIKGTKTNDQNSTHNKAVYESSMATIEEEGWSSDQE